MARGLAYQTKLRSYLGSLPIQTIRCDEGNQRGCPLHLHGIRCDRAAWVWNRESRRCNDRRCPWGDDRSRRGNHGSCQRRVHWCRGGDDRCGGWRGDDRRSRRGDDCGRGRRGHDRRGRTGDDCGRGWRGDDRRSKTGDDCGRGRRGNDRCGGWRRDDRRDDRRRGRQSGHQLSNGSSRRAKCRTSLSAWCARVPYRLSTDRGEGVAPKEASSARRFTSVLMWPITTLAHKKGPRVKKFLLHVVMVVVLVVAVVAAVVVVSVVVVEVAANVV